MKKRLITLALLCVIQSVHADFNFGSKTFDFGKNWNWDNNWDQDWNKNWGNNWNKNWDWKNNSNNGWNKNGDWNNDWNKSWHDEWHKDWGHQWVTHDNWGKDWDWNNSRGKHWEQNRGDYPYGNGPFAPPPTNQSSYQNEYRNYSYYPRNNRYNGYRNHINKPWAYNYAPVKPIPPRINRPVAPKPPAPPAPPVIQFNHADSSHNMSNAAINQQTDGSNKNTQKK